MSYNIDFIKGVQNALKNPLNMLVIFESEDSIKYAAAEIIGATLEFDDTQYNYETLANDLVASVSNKRVSDIHSDIKKASAEYRLMKETEKKKKEEHDTYLQRIMAVAELVNSKLHIPYEDGKVVNTW